MSFFKKLGRSLGKVGRAVKPALKFTDPFRFGKQLGKKIIRRGLPKAKKALIRGGKKSLKALLEGDTKKIPEILKGEAKGVARETLKEVGREERNRLLKKLGLPEDSPELIPSDVVLNKVGLGEGTAAEKAQDTRKIAENLGNIGKKAVSGGFKPKKNPPKEIVDPIPTALGKPVKVRDNPKPSFSTQPVPDRSGRKTDILEMLRKNPDIISRLMASRRK